MSSLQRPAGRAHHAAITVIYGGASDRKRPNINALPIDDRLWHPRHRRHLRRRHVSVGTSPVSGGYMYGEKDIYELEEGCRRPVSRSSRALLATSSMSGKTSMERQTA